MAFMVQFSKEMLPFGQFFLHFNNFPACYLPPETLPLSKTFYATCPFKEKISIDTGALRYTFMSQNVPTLKKYDHINKTKTVLSFG